MLVNLSMLLLFACSDYALVSSVPEVPGSVLINPTSHHEQDWEQLQDLSELDILVALDRSGSMADDIRRVTKGLSGLIEEIDEGVDDWRMNFITLDATAKTTEPLDKSRWSPVEIEMSLYSLHPAGGERGFSATYGYLVDHPEIPAPGSDLLMFIISDEKDHSSHPPELWVEWIRQISIDRDARIDFVPIVGVEGSNCIDEFDWGLDYRWAAQELGGDAVDLCDENWTDWLEQHSYLTRLEDFAVLEHNPIPETITVEIDGVAFEDFIYESPNILRWSVIPEAGVSVTINYDYNRFENRGL